MIKTIPYKTAPRMIVTIPAMTKTTAISHKMVSMGSGYP